MDPRSQEYFDKILAKPIEELSEDEKVFLRARRSYLKKSQVAEYDSVINPEEEKPPLYISKKNQTSEKTEPVKENDTESK